MEKNLRTEVRRQEELLQSKHQAELEHLRRGLEGRVGHKHKLQQSTAHDLDQERNTASALREETVRLEASLEPWRLLIAARIPCVLELVNFLHTVAPELQHLAYPTKINMPVLALEWPPHTELDTSLTWTSVAGDGGALHLLSRLCSGEIAPQELELTACCVDGRWIGALHGDVSIGCLIKPTV